MGKKYILVILAIALLLSVSSYSLHAASVLEIDNPSNGKRYVLLEPDTWENSQAEAKLLGGNLVTIESAEENTFVLNNLNPPAQAWCLQMLSRRCTPDLWIGLFDLADEGEHVWVSASPSSFRNWARGEPNDGIFDNPDEDFVHIIGSEVGGGGGWNDINVNGRQGGGVVTFGVVELVDSYRASAPLPDINGNGYAEAIALSRDKALIKDSRTGAFLRTIKPFGSSWELIDVASSDVDIDGSPEVLILGRNRKSERIVVEARNALSNRRVQRIRFFDANWRPIRVVTEDVDLDGFPDIGVFAERNDGRVALEYRGVEDGRITGSRIWFPRP